ncbi:MAG: hypothetical protein RRC34_06050 [Lentisphaeria bacterium]|nr:hypothetical protein [Lentisphaeria bacterium]
MKELSGLGCRVFVFALLLISGVVTAGGQVSPAADAFLKRLTNQYSATPALEIRPVPYTHWERDIQLIHMPGRGVFLQQFSPLSQESPDTIQVPTFFFLSIDGAYQVNALGERVDPNPMKYPRELTFAAPFLTPAAAGDLGDTRLEEDGEESRLVISVKDPGNKLHEYNKLPPHLRFSEPELVFRFRKADARPLGLVMTVLFKGERKVWDEWIVSVWQEVDGKALPREVRSIGAYGRFYQKENAWSAPWLPVSQNHADSFFWPAPETVFSVSESRAGAELNKNAWPTLKAARAYADGLKLWREATPRHLDAKPPSENPTYNWSETDEISYRENLSAARKIFARLAAEYPEAVAPRARVLMLDMLEDYPKAAETWFNWLRESRMKNGGPVSPFLLVPLFDALSPDQHIELERLYVDFAAMSLTADQLFEICTEDEYWFPSDRLELYMNLAEKAKENPASANCAVGLKVITDFLSESHFLEARALLEKCREINRFSLDEDARLFVEFINLESRFLEKTASLDAWRKEAASLPSPSPEQRWRLFQSMSGAEKLRRISEFLENENGRVFLDAGEGSVKGFLRDTVGECTLNQLAELPLNDLPNSVLLAIGRACRDQGTEELPLRIFKLAEQRRFDGWTLPQLFQLFWNVSRIYPESAPAMTSAVSRLCRDDTERAMWAYSAGDASRAVKDLFPRHQTQFPDLNPWNLPLESMQHWIAEELHLLRDSVPRPSLKDVEPLAEVLGGDKAVTCRWLFSHLGYLEPGEYVSYNLPDSSEKNWGDPAFPRPFLFWRRLTLWKNPESISDAWRAFRVSPAKRPACMVELIKSDAVSTADKVRAIRSEVARKHPLRGQLSSFQKVLKEAWEKDLEKQLFNLYASVDFENSPSPFFPFEALLWKGDQEEAARWLAAHFDLMPPDFSWSLKMGRLLPELSQEGRGMVLEKAQGISESPEGDLEDKIRLLWILYFLEGKKLPEKGIPILTDLLKECGYGDEVVALCFQGIKEGKDLGEILLHADHRLRLKGCKSFYLLSEWRFRDLMAEKSLEKLIDAEFEAVDTFGMEKSFWVARYFAQRKMYQKLLEIRDKFAWEKVTVGGANQYLGYFRKYETEALKAVLNKDQWLSGVIDRLPFFQDRLWLHNLYENQEPFSQLLELAENGYPDIYDLAREKLAQAPLPDVSRWYLLARLHLTFDNPAAAEPLARKLYEDRRDSASAELLLKTMQANKDDGQLKRLLTFQEKIIIRFPEMTKQTHWAVVKAAVEFSSQEEVRKILSRRIDWILPGDKRIELVKVAEKRGFDAIAGTLMRVARDESAKLKGERIEWCFRSGRFERAIKEAEAFSKWLETLGKDGPRKRHYLNDSLQKPLDLALKDPQSVEQVKRLVEDPGESLVRLMIKGKILRKTGEKREEFEALKQLTALQVEKGIFEHVGRLCELAEKNAQEGGEWEIELFDFLTDIQHPQGRSYGNALFRCWQAKMDLEEIIKNGERWALKSGNAEPLLGFCERGFKGQPQKCLEVITALEEGEVNDELQEQWALRKAFWLARDGKFEEALPILWKVRAENDWDGEPMAIETAFLIVCGGKMTVGEFSKVAKKHGGKYQKNSGLWIQFARKSREKGTLGAAIGLLEVARQDPDCQGVEEELAELHVLRGGEEWVERVEPLLAVIKQEKRSAEKFGRFLIRQAVEKKALDAPSTQFLFSLCADLVVFQRLSYELDKLETLEKGKIDKLEFYTRNFSAWREPFGYMKDMNERRKWENLYQHLLRPLHSSFGARQNELLLQLSKMASDTEHRDDGAALNLYAHVCLNQKKYQEAAESFARFFKVAPEMAVADDYFRHAQAFAALGNVSQADEVFQQAVEAGPAFTKELGKILNLFDNAKVPEARKEAFAVKWAIASGETRQFLEYFEQRKVRNPARWLELLEKVLTARGEKGKNLDYLPFQAVWLIEAGKVDEGLKMMRTLTKDTFPSSDYRQMMFGLFCDCACRTDTFSVTELMNTIYQLGEKKELDEPFFWKGLGEHVARKEGRGKAEVRVAFFEKAFELYPDDTEVRLFLVLAYMETGSTELWDKISRLRYVGDGRDLCLEGAFYPKLIQNLWKDDTPDSVLFDLFFEIGRMPMRQQRQFDESANNFFRKNLPKVMGYVRTNKTKVVVKGYYQRLAHFLALEKQTKDLDELYSLILSAAQEMKQTTAEVDASFFRCFSAAGDVDGVFKAAGRWYETEGFPPSVQSDILREWRGTSIKLGAEERFHEALRELAGRRLEDQAIPSFLRKSIKN